MIWDIPTSIGKTIEAEASNRPIKVAYLVPFDQVPNTHMVLDAVFYESYTRWAGVYTLIVPTGPESFQSPEYKEWLQHYDPDFIYSYVDVSDAFIDEINRLYCPIAFLRHPKIEQAMDEVNWRGFLPNWNHYIQPVSSITNVQSPASYSHFPHRERPLEPTVFTQYMMRQHDRFLADNFGAGFHLHNSTNPISGFFKTLCLVPDGLQRNMVNATSTCSTTLDAFRHISDGTAYPISRFAMINSVGMPRPISTAWSFSFRLFIGSSALDRLNFWNCRHLGSSWSNTSNALILEESFFDDDDLVKQLGKFLNNNNFLSQGNGPNQVEIHSLSLADNILAAIKDKLAQHTYNSVSVSRSYDAPAIPSHKDLENLIHSRVSDITTLKLTEDYTKIVATEPSHFMFIPPQRTGIGSGDWIVELNIQRHNNLSRFSNVVDCWQLPQRQNVTKAFTERLSKPTRYGKLALVPSSNSFPFKSQANKDPRTYEIKLPSDEAFFRFLVLAIFTSPSDDLRHSSEQDGYIELEISDKGQNLRGVVSLFDSLMTAYGILTKRFWRSVLSKANDDSSNPLTFDIDRLSSFLPNDRQTIQRLTHESALGNAGRTNRYLRAGLLDTLEYLVRSKVFFQVANWRCKYCGHANSRSFDNMRLKNECDVCSTAFFVPIDMEWKYELSSFVYRSLQKHNGLPVLWTLGYLQRRIHTGAFWYLPEVDLFESDEDGSLKNEIDILCVIAGKFYAVEVKSNASVFLNKEGAVDKLIHVVNLLRPDVAMLSFETYCPEGDDVEATKARLNDVAESIRARISPWSKLELLVAQDTDGYSEYSASLGWRGPRIGDV